MQITTNGRVSRAMGLANDSTVLDEGVYERCLNNRKAQLPGCSGEPFKASLLVTCAFI